MKSYFTPLFLIAIVGSGCKGSAKLSEPNASATSETTQDSAKKEKHQILEMAMLGAQEHFDAGDTGIRVIANAYDDKRATDIHSNMQVSLARIENFKFADKIFITGTRKDTSRVFKQAIQPGQYLLQISIKGAFINQIVSVPKGHVSQVLLYWTAENSLETAQFSPLREDLKTSLNTDYNNFVFLQLYAFGGVRDAWKVPQATTLQLYEHLKSTGFNDPVFLSVRFIMESTLPRTNEQAKMALPKLTEIGRKMLEVAPDSPDGHAVLGYVAERSEVTNGAADHFAAAVKSGIPTTSFLARLLLDGALRSHIENDNLQTLGRFNGGHLFPLWSSETAALAFP